MKTFSFLKFCSWKNRIFSKGGGEGGGGAGSFPKSDRGISRVATVLSWASFLSSGYFSEGKFQGYFPRREADFRRAVFLRIGLENNDDNNFIAYLCPSSLLSNLVHAL